MKLSIRIIPFGSTDYRLAVTLREEVLRLPLGLTFSENELAQEKDHIHFGAFLGDNLVATAAIAPKKSHCKLQRFAVKSGFQKQGVGTELLRFIENEARTRGFVTIYCSARDTAVSFYARSGYCEENEYFLEDGIPHVLMRKLLLGIIRLAKDKDIKEIDQKLGAFNQAMLSFVGKAEQPISYVINNDQEIIAGISACIDWGYILHIDLLFVDEKYRHQGIGSFLLTKIEQEARSLGAGLTQTDTFDFQGKDFYLKHGYEIFGVVDDSPRPGHKRFYLKKVLKSP